jgi:hypothetical protein
MDSFPQDILLPRMTMETPRMMVEVVASEVVRFENE